jgi:hypothetical protein
MSIDYHSLKSRVFPDVRQTYRIQDTLLYALSLGLGQDPLDERTLPYIYEGCAGGLRVLPTLAVVLGHPGFWAREPDAGIDWVRMLHGEQSLTVHRTVPADGTIVGRNRITHISDKGEGRGAIVVVERRLEDECGTLYATLRQLNFCRGDGGYSRLLGGQPSDEAEPALHATPATRAPDLVDEQRTRPETALLYADPVVARAAGFERPILHGLASYGLACRAILRQCAGDDPRRLRSLALRFTSPVYPGETLRTEIWHEAEAIRFRVLAVERDCVVMNHGQAMLW